MISTPSGRRRVASPSWLASTVFNALNWELLKTSCRVPGLKDAAAASTPFIYVCCNVGEDNDDLTMNGV